MRIFTGLFFLLFLISSQVNAGVTENDSLALVAVYDSTDGANWTTTWDLSQPVSTWHGVTIDNERVIKLDVWNNNLAGTIPSQIGNLDSLEYLRLYRNNLSGTIPTEIGNFKNLYYLDLYWNDLSGPIPATIGNLSKLENLRMQNNDLSGEIPAEIGNIDSLKYIALDQNDLSGAVPSEILNCVNLESFRAGSNQLTSIPDFSVLENFRDLWVSSNQLSGPIPDFFYDMVNVTTYNISNNDLEGEISGDIINLQKMSHFYWGGNNFSGSIPDEVSQLTKVVFLQLDNNDFSGEIPPEITDIPTLQFLRLQGNNLSGSIPKEIANAQNLKVLNLSNNNLSGNIPAELSTSQLLYEINLSGNQLEGEIPESFIDLTGLKTLYLNDNNLSGSIENRFDNAPDLNRVYLNDNNFKGAIPRLFTRLSNLQTFLIDDNSFDHLPSFKNSPGVSYISANRNGFTFEDLEMQMDAPINTFAYTSQDTALTEKNLFTPTGSSITLNMKIGGSNNHYQWFKDNQEIVADDLTGLYSISEMSQEDIGIYHCAVTNDSVESLTIFTAPINLQIGFSNLDSLALVDIFNATDGPNWSNKTNWLSNEPINNWYGITASGNMVSEIDLSSNGLSGEIPATICNLSEVTTINLSANNLSGNIPAEISRLNSLSALNISDNALEGWVPKDLTLMGNLTTLDLHNNSLRDLPDLTQSPLLAEFNISGNALTYEDLEVNVGAFATFNYLDQDSIGNAYSDTLEEGNNFEFFAIVDGSANKYQWFKNGVLIDGATDSNLVIEDALTSDSGEYICHVTNSIVVGLTIYTNPIKIQINPVLAISENDINGLPRKFSLAQNFPNPFNPTTQIKYTLAKSGKVELSVFNSVGQRVLELVNRVQNAGSYSVIFNADQLASGLYFYTLRTADKKLQRKMLLLK